MTVEELLELSNPDIEGLRSAFAIGCKTFGIDQQTCLALTLMLSTRWALLLMLAWFTQMEDRGEQPTTTEMVLIAEKVRDAQDRRIELGMVV